MLVVIIFNKGNNMWKIYKDNDQDLSFVLACVYCQAIDLNELKLWAERVVETSNIDDVPNYIYDLIDFDGPLFKISKIIGFSPINYLSLEEEYSIYGIAYIRKINVIDSPVEMSKAISLLRLNCYLLDKFKYFFPFIDKDVFQKVYP